jgi:hypothetical protein
MLFQPRSDGVEVQRCGESDGDVALVQAFHQRQPNEDVDTREWVRFAFVCDQALGGQEARDQELNEEPEQEDETLRAWLEVHPRDPVCAARY